VIATCRNPSSPSVEDLLALQKNIKDSNSHLRMRVETLDILSHDSIGALAKKFEQEGTKLHGIINNAGVGPYSTENLSMSQKNHSLDNSDEEFLKTFHLNVVGTHYATRSLLPFLVDFPPFPPLVVSISSTLGSIELNDINKCLYNTRGVLPFQLSKASLNMWNKTMSQQYKEASFVVACPGWLQTGQELNADLKPELAAFHLSRLVEKIQLEDSGKFFDLKMNVLPF